MERLTGKFFLNNAHEDLVEKKLLKENSAASHFLNLIFFPYSYKNIFLENDFQ